MKENRTLEFKSDVTNTFLKTVSAFANFGTGRILFGVADDGTICGIQKADSARLDIENRINDSITPKPDFSLEVDRKTNVITLTVREGRYKPYFYKGKVYRRSDTSTIEADQLEVRRLILEGNYQYYENLPCEMPHPTFHYLESKLKAELGITGISEDILRTFGFYTEARKWNNAAALFADQNSFYGIDIACFGDSISIIKGRETSSGCCILKQYDDAVAMFEKYYEYEEILGFERVKRELIPEEAYREAIANALVHRTWDINSHIRVSMFPDRIEIISPGGLPRGITKEEYLHGSISNLRNPTVGNIFFRLHYIEMFGTGIQRIRDAYHDFTRKPTFSVTDNTIGVILPTQKLTYEADNEEIKVLDLLKNGRHLSSREIAETCGYSKDKAIRILNRLLKKEYIRKIGNGRGTKYSLM